ncbi:hypothetical protein [Winogradskyella sp.]|uniref:hypothetical protein n=1 Tax=Winogradskyella sp. TaxID=1883156 RepID=UPI00260D7CA3|nr:hypothetical protein [Winogradskyella sp.]
MGKERKSRTYSRTVRSNQLESFDVEEGTQIILKNRGDVIEYRLGGEFVDLLPGEVEDLGYYTAPIDTKVEFQYPETSTNINVKIIITKLLPK